LGIKDDVSRARLASRESSRDATVYRRGRGREGEGRAGERPGGGAGGCLSIVHFSFFFLLFAKTRSLYFSDYNTSLILYKGITYTKHTRFPRRVPLSRARRIFLHLLSLSFFSLLFRVSTTLSSPLATSRNVPPSLSLSLSLSVCCLHGCTLPRNSSPMQPIMSLLALRQVSRISRDL